MENRGQQNIENSGLRITDYGLPSPTHLEQAILRTLRYFDIFSLPRTATQLWQFLLVPNPDAPTRWEGHHRYSLAEIRSALAHSSFLHTKLATQWGYYFLKNRPGIVAARLQHHRLAQEKSQILYRVTRLLAWVPFVKMIAISGSLALANAKPSSDLDVLLVVRAGRIWMARFLLIGLTQVTGRRRKHWDQAASDKVCLNHYVTDTALTIAPEIRNEYTAVLYAHLRPLYGMDTLREFHAANAGWMKRFAMYDSNQLLPPLPAVPYRRLREKVKRQLEGWLREPPATWVERRLESLQRATIMRHTRPDDGGRVVVSNHELAFHPHSKMAGILTQFAQEEGQQTLL